MPLAYWCVLIAALMPVALVAYAKSGSRDNNHPRDAVAALPGMKRRAYAAHQNAYENFPFFAVAVITATTLGASISTVNILAALYIVLRGVHARALHQRRSTRRARSPMAQRFWSTSRSSCCRRSSSRAEAPATATYPGLWQTASMLWPSGIEHERAVVVRMIVRANARRAVVLAAGSDRRGMERIDRRAVVGENGDVHGFSSPPSPPIQKSGLPSRPKPAAGASLPVRCSGTSMIST